MSPDVLVITWQAQDGILKCREHGVLADCPQMTPAETILMLEHLRDAHGKDVEPALTRVRKSALEAR